MRTNEERKRLIFQKTAEIKKKRLKRKHQIFTFGCTAACMTAVAAFGLFMSRIESNHLAKSEFSGSGAASLVAFHDAAGYIVMGLLSFLLGACVTVFLFKFRAVREHNREGKND